MNGSIRQRSAGSWELRAYFGVNPEGSPTRSVDHRSRQWASLCARGKLTETAPSGSYGALCGAPRGHRLSGSDLRFVVLAAASS